MTRSVNDKLSAEEPRTAPEPETAEERSKRLGMGAGAGGAVAVGGAAAAKFGGIKGAFWLIAWLSANALRFAGLSVVFALLVGVLLVTFVLRARREG